MVEVRRMVILPPVTTEILDAQVVAKDEEDIRRSRTLPRITGRRSRISCGQARYRK
jgi:hypothetical protein